NLVNKLINTIGVEFDNENSRGDYDLFDFDFYFLDEISNEDSSDVDKLIFNREIKSIKKINNRDISNNMCDCGSGTRVIDVRSNEHGIKVRLRQCKKCKVRIKTYELSTLKVMEILDNFLPVIIVDKISNALGVALDNEESEEDECSDFYFIDGTSSQSTLLDLFDDIDTNYEPR